MRISKKIVYRYNGDVATEEIVLDAMGDEPIPEEWSVVYRNGSYWKVAFVQFEKTTDRGALPIYRVYLANQK